MWTHTLNKIEPQHRCNIIQVAVSTVVRPHENHSSICAIEGQSNTQDTSPKKATQRIRLHLKNLLFLLLLEIILLFFFLLLFSPPTVLYPLFVLYIFYSYFYFTSHQFTFHLNERQLLQTNLFFIFNNHINIFSILIYLNNLFTLCIHKITYFYF